MCVQSVQSCVCWYRDKAVCVGVLSWLVLGSLVYYISGLFSRRCLWPVSGIWYEELKRGANEKILMC